VSLTSPLTLVFLGLLTVGTPAAAYLLWWRVRGPRLARAASRGAMVVVAQVCAVLLVAVAINDYGQLYSSWSQFVGSLSVHSDVRTLIARSTGAGDLRHFGAPEGLAPLADLRVPAVPAADFHTPFRPLPGVAWTGWSSPQQWHTRGAVARSEEHTSELQSHA